MKKLIAHRGNIEGPSNNDNHPQHIAGAIALGYDVEVDIWFIDNKFFFGHDCPQYEISIDFINQYIDNILYHCKNLSCFIELLDRRAHCFWHDKDDYALTNENYIIVYPTKDIPTSFQSIYMLLPEYIMCYDGKNIEDVMHRNLHGFQTNFPHSHICSDYVKILSEINLEGIKE